MRRRGLAALAVASLWCAAAPATAAAAPSAPPSGEPPWAPGVLRRLPPGDAPFPALVRTAGPGLAAALCARPGGGGGGGAAAPTGATQQQQQQQQQPQPAPHPCAPLLRLAHHALPGGGGCSRLYASAVHGFAASLRPSGVRALHACDPALLALVEHDYPVHALAEAAAEEGAPADGGGGGGGGGADWAGASPVVSADEEGVSGSGAAAGLPTLAAPGPGSAPPWSLDRLDQRSPPLDAAFATGAAVGSGVRIYVVDSGIRGTHDEFLAPDGVTSRAVLGVDLVASPPAETAAGLPVDVDGHGARAGEALPAIARLQSLSLPPTPHTRTTFIVHSRLQARTSPARPAAGGWASRPAPRSCPCACSTVRAKAASPML